jgi:hypothetical protein
MRRSRSGSPGHCLARHLPSSGFDYPRDGLLPRLPCPPCFVRAAPMGFTLRSILLAQGRRTFLHDPTRVPSLRPVASPNRSSTRRQDRRPASGRFLKRIPCGHDGCLARRPAGCSLGLFPSQGYSRQSCQPLPADSSLALFRRHSCPRRCPCASEFRSTGDSLNHEGQAPLSGFCTSTSLAFSLSTDPGYAFTS